MLGCMMYSLMMGALSCNEPVVVFALPQIKRLRYSYVIPNLGWHFRGSFWARERQNYLHSVLNLLKLCQKLEIWYILSNLHLVSENIPFSTRSLWCQYFFAKNQHFMVKIIPLFKAIVWELCRRFFSSVFSFCKIKGYYYWKCKFHRLCIPNPASRLLQIVCKSEKL